MGSKANFQQAPVHWPREITKAKLSPFLFTSFYQTMEKEGKQGNLGKFRQIWASLDKFGQVWTSLGMFGQVWASLGKFGQSWVSLGKKGNKNLSG